MFLILFCFSSSVYGNQTKYPIKETKTKIFRNYYANTKIICEKYIKKN